MKIAPIETYPERLPVGLERRGGHRTGSGHVAVRVLRDVAPGQRRPRCNLVGLTGRSETRERTPGLAPERPVRVSGANMGRKMPPIPNSAVSNHPFTESLPNQVFEELSVPKALYVRTSECHSRAK